MARVLMILALVAAAGIAVRAQARPAQANGIRVMVQFDNTLSRVQSNIKTVNKYMAQKLCRVDNRAVVALKGKDQSSLINHQSTVEFFCFGADIRKLLSNCNGRWNRHELKDEIEDHTTPDIEVQKVLSCTPDYMAMGRKL